MFVRRFFLHEYRVGTDFRVGTWCWLWSGAASRSVAAIDADGAGSPDEGYLCLCARIVMMSNILKMNCYDQERSRLDPVPFCEQSPGAPADVAGARVGAARPGCDW